MTIDDLELSCPKRRTTSSQSQTPAHGRSVTQMRLDRIWQEQSDTAWTEYVHWRREILGRPAHFPTARLTLWLAEVERDLELVGAQVKQPPEHWTGERWDRAHEMWLRLKGQRQAVAQTLETRAGNTSGPG